MERQPFSTVIALMLFLTVGARSGEADPLRVDLSLFGEHQSNVTARPVDELDGFVYRAGLDMKGSGEGRSYTWAIDGSFGYQEYEKDLLDARYDGNGMATASWLIRPGSFEWQLDYRESRQVVEIDQAPLGQNITTLRQVGTGPVVTFNISDMDRLAMYARRQRVERENDHYYSNEYGARLSRRIRPRHEIYLNGTFRETDFQVEISDYETYDAIAGYAYVSDKTSVTLEVGRGWLKEEESAEPVESGTGFARFSWFMPSERSLSLSARQRFSDEAGDLLDTDALPSEISVQGTGAFRERRVALDYFGGTRVFHPSISAWAREKRYFLAAVSQRDIDETGGNVRTRLYSGDTTYVSIAFSQIRREFPDTDRLDDDMQADLDLTRLLTPRVSVTAGTGWFHRNSTDPPSEYSNVVVNLELKVQLR